MKLFKLNTIAIAALVTSAFAFTSCDQDAEGPKYSPESDACYSFANNQMTFEVTAEENGVVNIPVYRGKGGAEATIDVTVVEADEIFSAIQPTVTFANGENVAYIQLNFGSIDNLGATSNYNVVLALNDSILSPAGVGEINVTVKRQLTWEYIGDGTYATQLFGEQWTQPVYKAKEGPIYRLPDCIFAGYPLVFSLTEDLNDLAGYDIQPIGYSDATYGMLYYRPSQFVRSGDILIWVMDGLVVYNGGWGRLYSGFQEMLLMPEGWDQY